MCDNTIEPVPFGMMIDGVKYTNAKEVRGDIQSGEETAEDGSGVNFESADFVTAGDVQFLYPLKSLITSDYESITITTVEEVAINDAGGAEVQITPIGTGIIKVSKTLPATYNISSAEISYIDERFVADNRATLTMDKDTGFGCIEIEPQGTYYKNYGDIRKDFAMHAYQESYKLCFKKTAADTHPIPTSEENYGLVDFVDKTMYLNGMIQYLRYPFAETITSAILMQ